MPDLVPCSTSVRLLICTTDPNDRSSLRHELSKFRDVKFFRVPKEHGRAGRGDCWAYVGDGDPRTRALIDRIIQERGHAKDYSKRHHS